MAREAHEGTRISIRAALVSVDVGWERTNAVPEPIPAGTLSFVAANPVCPAVLDRATRCVHRPALLHPAGSAG